MLRTGGAISPHRALPEVSGKRRSRFLERCAVAPSRLGQGPETKLAGQTWPRCAANALNRGGRQGIGGFGSDIARRWWTQAQNMVYSGESAAEERARPLLASGRCLANLAHLAGRGNLPHVFVRAPRLLVSRGVEVHQEVLASLRDFSSPRAAAEVCELLRLHVASLQHSRGWCLPSRASWLGERHADAARTIVARSRFGQALPL